MKIHSILIVVAAFAVVVSCASADDSPAAFLRTHCVRCHGDQKQKADRRFDTLSPQITTIDELERYQEIVDQLNLESMPPEGEPQPSADERAAAIAYLTRRLKVAQEALNTSGGHSALRRLNSWEYRQTIGELLGLNVEEWNPAEDFPAEVKIDGFDNILDPAWP